MSQNLNDSRKQRKNRIRKIILKTTKRPRLSVYRSSKHISAQIIDDQKRVTLAAASEADLNKKLDHQTKESNKEDSDQRLKKMTKLEKAAMVGQIIAQIAIKKKISDVTFDRGSYKFHGRVKALAEAARKAGLIY